MITITTDDKIIPSTINLELNNVIQYADKVEPAEETLDLAYQLIYDASVGRITHFERTTSCLKSYRFYLSRVFRFVRIIFHCTLVILLIFDATNRDAKSVTAQVTVTIECLCLTFYSFQLFLVFRFTTKHIFFRDKKHYVTASAILVSIVDIILFMSYVYEYRIGPALRVFLFMNSAEQSQIRRQFRTLRMTIYNVLLILPFLITFYFMMVVFIYRYFKVTKYDQIYYYNGKPYMQTLETIVWDTLVYITSANSPDIMLPAFSSSSVLGILFLIFYALMFFLLIFIYGLIMGNFRNHSKEEMRNLIIGKMSLVYDAFLLLTEKQNTNDEEEVIGEDSIVVKNVVKKEKWLLLMQYFKKYGNSKEAVDVIYSLLSDNNKTYLTKNEFMQMGDLLSIPLDMITNDNHFFEQHLWFPFSNKLAHFVENKYFSFLVAFFIIMNSLCIAFSNDQVVELCFSILFLIEIFIRIYVKGITAHFCSLWNIFDFLVIVLACVFWIVENTIQKINTITFALLVLRNLRLLKLLRGIAQYQKLLHILGMLIPTIVSLLTIVFWFTVLFVCIGIWSYQGLFFENHSTSDYMFNSAYCNNTSLKNSDFGRFHYCILSFNSFIAGFVTLCSISIGNNWHIISEGYELGSKHVVHTKMFFCCFKGGITYLLLLIVAFVLDVFLLAYNQKGSLKIEDKVNGKLKHLNVQFTSYKNVRDSKMSDIHTENSSSILRYFRCVKLKYDKQIWFRLKEKGARSVEYVSQAMFQTEIESDLKLSMRYMHFFDSSY